MKKSLLLFVAIICAYASFSQGSAGLVAHWKFNGNALDVSGNGHDGTMRNTITTSGKAGMTNTALQFNGTNSYVVVPDAPDLNLSYYSICATIKVSRFYTGLCDANSILARSKPGSTGSYYLYFTNEPYQGCTCAGVDTNEFNFCETAGTNPADCASWQYSPAIREDVWYSVVGTFDGTDFRVYVNGIMKTDNPSTSPSPIGSGGDSLVIGMDTWDGSLYPYPFNGAIDDIRLYNRVLSDLEIAIYTSSTLDVPNSVSNEPEIMISPNPAHNKVNVQLSDNNTKGTLQLVNAMGQLIAEKEINDGAVNFDIASLPAGIYLLRMQFNEQVFFRKFIKE